MPNSIGLAELELPSAKTMIAAAWSVKPNCWYFRNDVAKGYGRGLPYGVRLLVLAA